METPTTEQPCSSVKVKTEIEEEPPQESKENVGTSVVRPNDLVNHIKVEKPLEDEDQKPDPDCPPLKKRKPENVAHGMSKEPDKTHESRQNVDISGFERDNSSATEEKINPNHGHILATFRPDKGNDEIKRECSSFTLTATNQTTVKRHRVLPDICPNTDKMEQIKSEPEDVEENSYIRKTRVNGKRKEEKIKWFRCKSEGCPYKTRYYVVFVRHQLSHKYRSRLKCRYCSFSCKSRAMLTCHLLEHVDAQNKSSKSPDADDLKELNWSSCPVDNCSFKTKNRVDFEKHSSYHQRQKLLKCRYCLVPCRDRVRMKAHILRHHSGENDKRKPCADEQPDIHSSNSDIHSINSDAHSSNSDAPLSNSDCHSSNSDSESEVDIIAMIVKDKISDVNRQKYVGNEYLHEENSQRASQDQDKLRSCDPTNELAHILRLGDPKGEKNQNESEVSRTITITIKHSNKSDDSSSLKTALISGILQSFGMSDKQASPSQTHVAEEDDNRESHVSVPTECLPSGESEKPTEVADILRLFNVPNEEGESGSSSVNHQKHSEVLEIQGESGKTDTFSAPNENTVLPELFRETTEICINEEPPPILSANQLENYQMETSTHRKPEESAENNVSELQQSITPVETSITDGKFGELAKNNGCELQQSTTQIESCTTYKMSEQLSKNNECELRKSTIPMDSCTTDKVPEELAKNNERELQKSTIPMESCTTDRMPEELAKNNECELQKSTIPMESCTTDRMPEELAKNNECELQKSPVPMENCTTNKMPEGLAKNNECELQKSTIPMESCTTDKMPEELVKNNECELQKSTIPMEIFTTDKIPEELAENNECELQKPTTPLESCTTDSMFEELAENNECELQKSATPMESCTTDRMPEELAKNNECELQQSVIPVETSITSGKFDELAKNNDCELQQSTTPMETCSTDEELFKNYVYELQQPTTPMESFTTDRTPVKFAKDNECELQQSTNPMETSSCEVKPEDLAENNECELRRSTSTPNDIESFCKSDTKKLMNLKQIVIRRVRKNSFDHFVPTEDMRTYSSRIRKSVGLCNEEIKCTDSQCPYKTASRQDMKLHLPFHEDTRLLKCPSCTYGCQSVSDLKDHMNLHIEKSHSMWNNVEISPLTSSMPPRKPNEGDTGQDLKPLIICNPIFRCKFCPSRLNHEKLFKLHLLRHCSTSGIKCPLCTYRSTKTDLLNHLSCHVENVDAMFLCPLCTEKKRNKESLNDHVKVIHSRALFQEHNATCTRTVCNGHC